MTKSTEPELHGYYHLRVAQEVTDDGVKWTASHPDLLGCHAVANDALTAVRKLSDIREEWLQRAISKGAAPPEPNEDPSYELILVEDHTEADVALARRAVRAVAEPVVFIP